MPDHLIIGGAGMALSCAGVLVLLAVQESQGGPGALTPVDAGSDGEHNGPAFPIDQPGTATVHARKRLPAVAVPLSLPPPGSAQDPREPVPAHPSPLAERVRDALAQARWEVAQRIAQELLADLPWRVSVHPGEVWQAREPAGVHVLLWPEEAPETVTLLEYDGQGMERSLDYPINTAEGEALAQLAR